MASKSNNKQGNSQAKASGPVTCMDCLHSALMQYGCNPILADCHEKPQPGNERFPYQREVARAIRICPLHKHTDKEKVIERISA